MLHRTHRQSAWAVYLRRRSRTFLEQVNVASLSTGDYVSYLIGIETRAAFLFRGNVRIFEGFLIYPFTRTSGGRL